MMSLQELFYGDVEPVWVVNSAAAQIIHGPLQQDSHYQDSEIREYFPQYKSPLQNKTQYFPTHRDCSPQMGRHTYQFPQNSPRQSTPLYNYQSACHQHDGRANPLPPCDCLAEEHHHNSSNHSSHPRRISPLQRSPQRFGLRNITYRGHNENVPFPHFDDHQPSAPPMDAHQLRMHGHRHEWPETVRVKVPMCCEACEERVMITLSKMKGVQLVECDFRRKKVTITGIASAADILKCCKKIFKRSEMWVDRYY